jgi:hypothetical protein
MVKRNFLNGDEFVTVWCTLHYPKQSVSTR